MEDGGITVGDCAPDSGAACDGLALGNGNCAFGGGGGDFEMGGGAIEEFTTNLTESAFNGNLDPVVGRDDEITRVIQILARRRKNNPVLIGEPGVGKTAVAEGLAQRIVERDVPALLDDKQVISLDVGLLLAGTKYRGEFEERLKRIVDEVRNSANIVLVIDEVHTLIGAGAAEGAVDAANILKPALARGELQCLGATTIEEYRKHIERDSALERRFQPVQVPEPSVGDTVDILRCLRARYERHHGLKIGDDALEAASRMGAQYIADRFLPDKAIDLIDEACARVRLRATRAPDSATSFKRELRDVMKEKESAIREQDFERAADILDREIEIRAQLNIILSTVKRVSSEETPTYEAIVCEEDIANVVAAWTGIPVNKLSKTESEKLLLMEDTLHSRIIGQEQAVSAVSRAVRRARVGLRNPNRPIASFLFSGPTGVGKTELTKALALYFFGAEDAMVRLDMSEYMERHTVAKLIGSPPGYVGYSEGGQLTEAVRRKPYTVVLFDEIEKGHPDIYSMLLQILDDGFLTDSVGRKINFQNTIMIMTSNIGVKQINDFGTGVGFDTKSSVDQTSKTEQKVIQRALKNTFAPEFLNRVDDCIIFNSLSIKDINKIVTIEINKLKERVKNIGYDLSISVKAKSFICEKGFDKKNGARPLNRMIQKYVEDLIAENLVSNKIKQGDKLYVDHKPGLDNLILLINKKETAS